MADSTDADFLRSFLTKLQAEYSKGLDLHEANLTPTTDQAPTTSRDEERAARLAEAAGFNGNIFRNLLPDGGNWSVAKAQRQLKARIELVPRVIAKLESSPTSLASSGSVELLSVREVAALLNMGVSTVRANDRKGLIPRPKKIGGAVKWSRQELLDWIKAGSPARERWEASQQGRA